MAFYTGKGDGGTSKLFDTTSGVRVPKSSPIFEALGTFDELTTIVGFAKVAARELPVEEKSAAAILHEVQDHLFTIQAELAGAGKTIPEASVAAIEGIINGIESSLPPVTTFLVPGATELSARLDMARAMSRRAERRLVILNERGERPIGEHTLRYANRLSSLLYALARLANHAAGADEAAPSYR
ncbi:MAG TPA: cob(I)yrinic acid a,c-diamide adenosyltransferase [Candidatus Paceibacterota bacterium]|nr:cob(I)yrinic acid a,c-diamide adenosyltransferase [Candidatus Paceibacterota bacterium]